MSERNKLRYISAVMFIVGFISAVVFVSTGFGLDWLIATVVSLVGSFMAFAISFAAESK